MKNLLFILPLIGGLFLFSGQLYGQTYQEAQEKQRIERQQSRDESTMTDLKDFRQDSKAKAKEANRIEKEAKNALKESQKSVRAERRAQKARSNATKQAQKASKARIKSDRN